MTLAKGDRVVTNRRIGDYGAGERGRIIRVDVGWVSSTKYAVLLDEDGSVIENITEDDLFGIDQD